MTRGRAVGIWAFIVLMALGAASVHWWAVRPLIDQGRDWPLAWLLLVGIGFFAAELLVVHLRLGREAYAFSMMELPLVIGLFFVRPDLLVVARLAGSLLAFVIRRKAFQKATFNCAMFALETTCAVSLWHFLLHGAQPLGPWGWLATLVVALLISALSSVLVSAAITIATGQRPRSVGEVVGLGQIGDVANACFALMAVFILTVDWRAGWLLGVLAGVLLFAYRSYEGARQRSESLERVNRFTELVGRDVSLDAVVASVMSEVGASFDATTVELRISGPSEQGRGWSLSGGDLVGGPTPVIDGLVEHAQEGALLVPRGNAAPGLMRVMRDVGVRDCVMVPLRDEEGVSGSLVVADRVSDVATFGAADLRQMRALANHAAVALANAARAELMIRQAEAGEHAALHDELTGLANRRLFARRLDEALVGGSVSLFLLDLDRFSDVNDTLGHEIGDRLLAVVAERIIDASPQGAVVARLGGDEFAVLLPREAGRDDALVAAAVRDALVRPVVLNGLSISVDSSVGVVLDAGGDSDSLLRCADLAMHAAKRSRLGLETYRRELDKRDFSRLGLLADLRDAVASKGLEVHYQPKLDLASGVIVGVEALARWTHPTLGPIPPDEFIPLAEHSTLITPLTLTVLSTALEAAARWGAREGTFSMAVNISPRSLLDPTFVDQVSSTLAGAGVPADALTLEITETNLMADPDRAVEALVRLRELGVRLSVDDLGTGYSSLAYLQRLPVHEVKIDRSFLADFQDESSQAVVAAIVELGHRLGYRVVAEGVENAGSLDALRRLGCDTAQGFLIARPMPEDRMTAFLASGAPRGADPLRLVR
ncbi:MAG: bifunctional diguanylate cyclase/phosphodiesterase [Nocardioides sp.]